MFGDIKAKLAVASVVVLGAVAAPSGASATVFPAVAAGGAATCWSTVSATGSCTGVDFNTTFSGNITWTIVGLSITCTLTMDPLRHLAAGPVGGAEASPNSPLANCSVAGFPNCVVTKAPQDLPWRGQAVSYTGPPNPPAIAKYLFINVSYRMTFGANYPAPRGTVWNDSGLLALRLHAAPGGSIVAATITAPYNQVTGGTTLSGTFAKTGGSAFWAV